MTAIRRVSEQTQWDISKGLRCAASTHTHTFVHQHVICFIIYEASVYSLRAENNYHQHTGLCQAFVRYLFVDIMIGALEAVQQEIVCL